MAAARGGGAARSTAKDRVSADVAATFHLHHVAHLSIMVSIGSQQERVRGSWRVNGVQVRLHSRGGWVHSRGGWVFGA